MKKLVGVRSAVGITYSIIDYQFNFLSEDRDAFAFIFRIRNNHNEVETIVVFGFMHDNQLFFCEGWEGIYE